MPIDAVSAVIAGGGALVCAVSGALASRAFGNARLLTDAVPTPVADLSEGLHECAGRLKAKADLVAPATARPCAAYRLLLEQRRRSRWETVLDERVSRVAGLEDDTGSVALDLAAADVVVASPDRVRTGIFSVPSPELDALLARVGPTVVAPAGPFLRWREELLMPGDRVFVVGTAAGEPGSWRLVQVEDAPLLVSDREEGEVVRHQRRAGQRLAAIAAVGLAVAAYGGWRLLPSLGA